ncbi:abnormal spindle-like microcephaly-associated protein homolog [Drosophila tropicalis]|uniref:abnormal spindle-like microcephaly-associated protein homolog n=1 Tax=Drosophila tropicalis TaxID=46794 RepID=UPI0035AC2344
MYIYPSSPESASSLQSEESAAIKIQAGFRGYRVRKQLHRQTKTTSNGYLSHRHSNQHNRRHQRLHGNTAMENQQKPTATNENAPAVANVDADMTSEADRCATKIQAGFRGFLVRKKQKIATDAAVKIQAGFRGFKARKELKQS